MPRCRTAWLSLCLSALGTDCSHEGLRDHDSFEAYADELDERLQHGAAGDSDPGLVLFIAQIVERWPEARFVVVTGEDEEVLESVVAVAREDEREKVRAGWRGYVTAFKAACDVLRTQQKACYFTLRARLESDDTMLELFEFAANRRPSLLWLKRMQRLRVLSKVDSSECRVRPVGAAIDVPNLDALHGVDVSGLMARLYRNADFAMVSQWWTAHGASALMESSLPPLGVVVERYGEPVAALWVYEIYGAPVAELVFPVTRPGLPLTQTAAALSYAVTACMATAGKGHTPEAFFRHFKVFATPGMTRHLSRLGFKKALKNRVAMTCSL